MKSSIIIVALFVCATAVSCSKKDTPVPSADYYFRFKVNGVQVDYPYRTGIEHNLIGNVNMAGHDADLGSYYVCNLAGMRTLAEGGALNNYRNNLVIFMQHPEKFDTGVTYSNVSSGSTMLIYQLFMMGYYDNDGVLYSASNLNNNPYSVFGNATVTFDEITDTNVKGSFSGALEARDVSNGIVVVTGTVDITDGEFFVPSFRAVP
ncbi:hypothetical protein SAMN05660226_03589 [Parapedobacter luteus]|uniref:Uncharacterized protein n=1 Tax=Parapedobacter luteus TaxID=623280 RepID=A0A1T5EVC6_9SPHI|nr:hypothetical protein [Parapedobacter luteus]SKB87841.1 hypothetical protein SAMN05660226_03589 [Parapedobacter luteus]